jgi:rhodanese-related sulfurtransferase
LKKKITILIFCLLLIFVTSIAAANVDNIKLLVNGKDIQSDVAPLMQNDRVLVPIRIVAEALGCDVNWDSENSSVVITRSSGDKFLKGKNDASQSQPTIHTNFVKAVDLKAALDDSDMAKHPLVVDVRTQKDYDVSHIPGAVWIAEAQNIAEPGNLTKLEDALADHVAKGGKNEIVIYCYTGNTAGLAAGVLGDAGLNVKNMRFGYSIAWEGTRQADAPIFGPRVDKDGNPVAYETPVAK